MGWPGTTPATEAGSGRGGGGRCRAWIRRPPPVAGSLSAKLEEAKPSPRSGGLEVGGGEEEVGSAQGSAKVNGKRRRSKEVDASSEESSTARSARPFRRFRGCWTDIIFGGGPNPERSLRSLQSRWTNNIKPEVGKFAGYYAEALRQNPSGMSDADKTTLATGNFAAVEGHAFGFMHCWEHMKDEPKWGNPTQVGTEGDLEGADLEEDSNRVHIDAYKSSGKRPMGRDKAKAANKKSKSVSGDTSSSEYASRMQDLSIQKITIMQEESVRKGERFQQLATIDEKRYQEMRSHNQSVLGIEQEKVRIMCEKHDREEKKEDERILSINLDSCTPSLRMYYETLQEDIMAKLAARRQGRHAP